MHLDRRETILVRYVEVVLISLACEEYEHENCLFEVGIRIYQTSCLFVACTIAVASKLLRIMIRPPTTSQIEGCYIRIVIPERSRTEPVLTALLYD